MNRMRVVGGVDTRGTFDVDVDVGAREADGYGEQLGEGAVGPYLQTRARWIDLSS